LGKSQGGAFQKLSNANWFLEVFLGDYFSPGFKLRSSLLQQRSASEEEQAGPSRRESSPEVLVVEAPAVGGSEVPDTKPGPQELQPAEATAMVQGMPGSVAWEMQDAGPNLVLRRITTYVIAKPAEPKKKKSNNN
jgi:hypothetical protein